MPCSWGNRRLRVRILRAFTSKWARSFQLDFTDIGIAKSSVMPSPGRRTSRFPAKLKISSNHSSPKTRGTVLVLTKSRTTPSSSLAYSRNASPRRRFKSRQPGRRWRVLAQRDSPQLVKIGGGIMNNVPNFAELVLILRVCLLRVLEKNRGAQFR